MGEYEKMLAEINLERARYLQSTDHMVEEMLENHRNTVKVEFSRTGTSEPARQVSD
ncbi:Uncharacterised protein [uncultured archaeon]|nr:Uncharacterised protein [uncultured archaeon]